MEAHFQDISLLRGMCAAGFKLGTIMTGGWFWMRTKGCCVLYLAGDQELSSLEILNVSDFDAASIQLPSWMLHEVNHEYLYVLRRAGSCGREEQSYSAVLRLSIDESGQLVTHDLNPVLGLQATAQPSAMVRLNWAYYPKGQRRQPLHFRVMAREFNTAGQDFADVVLVDYSGQGSYHAIVGPFDSGRYVFQVFAESIEGNTAEPVASEVEIREVVNELLQSVSLTVL